MILSILRDSFKRFDAPMPKISVAKRN